MTWPNAFVATAAVAALAYVFAHGSETGIVALMLVVLFGPVLCAMGWMLMRD